MFALPGIASSSRVCLPTILFVPVLALIKNENPSEDIEKTQTKVVFQQSFGN